MLTVSKATSQARRHVDKLMPGVMATVESFRTADQITLEPVMHTVITYPADHHNRMNLGLALQGLPGYKAHHVGTARLVVIRTA